MKTLMIAVALLTSTHAFAAPVELLLGTWEGKAETPAGDLCTVQVVVQKGAQESDLQLTHSVRCDESSVGDLVEGWSLKLRSDGKIGADEVDGDAIPQSTWSRTGLQLNDPKTNATLILMHSNPVLDVVPYVHYEYADHVVERGLELTGMLTKTK